MILVFLFIAQTIVCANLYMYALTNSNFTRLIVEKYQWAVMQCKIIEWKLSASVWSFARNKSWNVLYMRISHHRMKQVLNKFRIKRCLSSYISLPAKLLLIQSEIFGPIRAPQGGSTTLIELQTKLSVYDIWVGPQQNQQSDLSTQQRLGSAWTSSQSDQSLCCAQYW